MSTVVIDNAQAEVMAKLLAGEDFRSLNWSRAFSANVRHLSKLGLVEYVWHRRTGRRGMWLSGLRITEVREQSRRMESTP